MENVRLYRYSNVLEQQRILFTDEKNIVICMLGSVLPGGDIPNTFVDEPEHALFKIPTKDWSKMGKHMINGVYTPEPIVFNQYFRIGCHPHPKTEFFGRPAYYRVENMKVVPIAAFNSLRKLYETNVAAWEKGLADALAPAEAKIVAAEQVIKDAQNECDKIKRRQKRSYPNLEHMVEDCGME